MPLTRFAAPGNVDELSNDDLDSWSDRLSELFDAVAAPEGRHFYNPTTSETPADAAVAKVTWPAAPGRLLSRRLSPERRWEIADGDRNEQDEYCEWSVLRDGDKVVRVTFTTETPDYFDHLLDVEEKKAVALYEAATGKPVTADDLRGNHGVFEAANELNSRTDGPIVHLMQQSNTLRAAVVLAAEATVLRKGKNGEAIRHPQTLIVCGGLGDERRHSDPRIASAVNNLVARRFEITLQDPVGLYLDRFVTTGMTTPDDADAREFWTIERGEPGHALRARFEVPAGRGYAVGDITIGDQPIVAGAQLAERLSIRIEAVARPAKFSRRRRPCNAGTGL
ncbi:MAG: hypothetical protein M3134_04640 [Actinomycetota bacterium]|nr:hypothetical protein [Actinomycetota bacterium]